MVLRRTSDWTHTTCTLTTPSHHGLSPTALSVTPWSITLHSTEHRISLHEASHPTPRSFAPHSMEHRTLFHGVSHLTPRSIAPHSTEHRTSLHGALHLSSPGDFYSPRTPTAADPHHLPLSSLHGDSALDLVGSLPPSAVYHPQSYGHRQPHGLRSIQEQVPGNHRMIA